MYLPTKYRTCTRCLRTREINRFRRRQRGKEARQAYCKDCANEVARVRRARSRKSDLRAVMREVKRPGISHERLTLLIRGLIQRMGGWNSFMHEVSLFWFRGPPQQRLRLFEFFARLMMFQEQLEVQERELAVQEEAQNKASPTYRMTEAEIFDLYRGWIEKINAHSLLEPVLRRLRSDGKLTKKFFRECARGVER